MAVRSVHSSVMIHDGAHVADCVIGARTKVWQFASVIRAAKIGEDCNVGSCAIIDAAVIGDRCAIGAGASINPGIKIGSDVFIGPNVTLCNDRWPRVAKEGFDIDRLLSGAVVVTNIKDGASVGAGAIVLPGVTIGEGVMIAAGAVVDRSILPWHLFKRSGTIVPIDQRRTIARVKEAA